VGYTVSQESIICVTSDSVCRRKSALTPSLDEVSAAASI
jgi:hypothetical protein